MRNLFRKRKRIITPTRLYSLFSSGNQFPLKGKPQVKSIEQLSADSEEVLYEQTGKKALSDQFGVPKNVRIVPNRDVREIAVLALKCIYNTSDLSSERIEAGEALGYSNPRIAFHEFFFRKNKKPTNDSNQPPIKVISEITRQLPTNSTNSQIQYKGFENVCPLAEMGSCVLSRDAEKFYKLCATSDHEYCSKLDDLLPAWTSVFSIFSGKDEE